MSDEVTIAWLDNGHAVVTLFGGTVTLNPAQLENLRRALVPEQKDPEPKKAPKKTRTAKHDPISDD